MCPSLLLVSSRVRVRVAAHLVILQPCKIGYKMGDLVFAGCWFAGFFPARSARSVGRFLRSLLGLCARGVGRPSTRMAPPLRLVYVRGGW